MGCAEDAVCLQDCRQDTRSQMHTEKGMDSTACEFHTVSCSKQQGSCRLLVIRFMMIIMCKQQQPSLLLLLLCLLLCCTCSTQLAAGRMFYARRHDALAYLLACPAKALMLDTQQCCPPGKQLAVLLLQLPRFELLVTQQFLQAYNGFSAHC
jgi:hypothetical protein